MVCEGIYTNHYNDVPTFNSVGTDSFGVGIPSKTSTQTMVCVDVLLGIPTPKLSVPTEFKVGTSL
jgi:hypothetical protein